MVERQTELRESDVILRAFRSLAASQIEWLKGRLFLSQGLGVKEAALKTGAAWTRAFQVGPVEGVSTLK